MSKHLVFDSEFTDNTGELLELSIFDIRGHEIYHSYFKPRKAKTWMLYPHNISPEMVADKPYFDKEAPTIQALFDSATHLVGFEVESDIEHLHEQGIAGLYYKKQVELRDLYWLVRGNEKGYGLHHIPGLDKCAAQMDIQFDENGAHSASGDTHATWQLFIKLLTALCGDDAPTQIDDENASQIWERANDKIIEERSRLAHGYVTLLKEDNLFRISGTATAPDTNNPKYFCHIEVDDWKRAVCELEIMKFAYTSRSNRDGLYRLGPKEIKQFQKYSNTYDPARADEYRKMYNLAKRRKR